LEPIPLTAEQIAKREECLIPIESFDDLSQYIDLKIIRGVMAYGFDVPSPIQQKAIKPFLSKFDLIAQAQSGTGKTATFCIGTLGNIDFTKNETQAIILAHTMELAQQIEHVFSNIGKYIEVRLALAVKSIPVRDNINMILGKNTDGLLPHVVIGTPGRLLDMITKKIINIDTIRVLVLDEADELLSEGFITQIKQIISSIGTETQIGLFSATMDTNFFKMTEKFLRNPINILINKENLTLDGIKQYNIECEKNEWKFDTLCDLYSLFSTSQTIIYCNFHQSVELLTKKLQEQNFKVSLIHGSMDITEREDAMKKFRSLNTRVLISTDLLGRGIDVQQVSIVINYDIPFKNESYIHRIGRSGRYGRKGTAINLVTPDEMTKLRDIERHYGTNISPLPNNISEIVP
jgi:translation initiation factor 4A